LHGGTGLFVERITGSQPRMLVRENLPGWERGPEPVVWSPDGKQLLIASSSGSRLAVVTVATGVERFLPLPDQPSVVPLGWSGPADEILFEAGSGRFAERLIIARPTGASPRTVYSQDDSDEGAPLASLSPDGKWIAYTAEGLHADPYYPFGVIDVASGKTTPIDNFHGFVETPVWAPDSSRFAVGFSVFSNRGVRLYSTGMPSATPVAWTDAGLYLAAESKGSSTLIFVPTGQNSAETLFSLPHHREFDSVQPLG
jgi:Tol biopolymer transport system component